MSQEESGVMRDRIEIVPGDVTQRRFGLTIEAWQQAGENLQAVFHAAAYTGFDRSQIEKSVAVNNIYILLIQGNIEKGLQVITALSEFYGLRDRLGKTRLLVPDQYCRNHLLAEKDLCLLDVLPYVAATGARAVCIEGQYYR